MYNFYWGYHRNYSSIYLKVLIAAGATVDAIVAKNNDTALTLASFRGNIEAVRALAEAKANLDHVSGRDRNCSLHFAARHGVPEIVKILAKFKANVDLPNLVSGGSFSHLDIITGTNLPFYHLCCCF